MTHLAEDLYAKEEAMRKRTESLEDESALLKSQLMHLAAQQRHDNVSLIAFSVAPHEDFGTENSNTDYSVTYVNIGGDWHEQTLWWPVFTTSQQAEEHFMAAPITMLT